MKKLYFVLFFSIFVLSVFSQRIVKLGVRGGLNFSNPQVSAKTSEGRMGFHAGPTIEVDPLKKFGFASGVYFNVNGFNYTYENDRKDIETSKVSIYSLDMPITVDYRQEIVKKLLAAFLETGPYINMGLNGVQEIKTKIEGRDVVVDKDFMYNDIDYGVLFGGGLELAFLKVGVNYNLGLAKLGDMMDGKNRILKVYISLR
ncbi:MAG: porin family protein [Bacteroidales bacterium]